MPMLVSFPNYYIIAVDTCGYIGLIPKLSHHSSIHMWLCWSHSQTTTS